MDGYHGRFFNARSEKIYLITDGSIEFEVDGVKTTASAGDLFVIPPNLPHSMVGDKVTMVITCSPPFNPVDEKKV